MCPTTIADRCFNLMKLTSKPQQQQQQQHDCASNHERQGQSESSFAAKGRMPATVSVGGWADVMDLESNINQASNELTLTSNTNEEDRLGDDTDEGSVGTATGDGGDARHNQLAARENKSVRRTKYFVIASLLAITIGVSILGYFLAHNLEQKDFENQFLEDADKVLSTMGVNLVRTLQASDAFAVSVTSLAAATGQTWPYVVVPDFAVRAEKIRSLASAVYVSMYMIVKPGQRATWENYTAEVGPAWVNESIAVIEEFGGDRWPVVRNYTLWNVIHDYDEFDKENPGEVGVTTPGPWIPMWQTQPTIAYEPPYNWDLMSVPPTNTMTNITAHETVIRNRMAVITEAYLVSYPNDTDRIELDKEDAEWILPYLQEGEEPMEPISDIFYPIVTNANTQIELGDTTAGDVGAILTLSVYWRETIKNILPEGSSLRVVFTNPCSPTFTYEINGPDVTFLGTGDHHEEKYDGMSVKKFITEFAHNTMEDTFYFGCSVDEEFCPFRVVVYPHSKMEETHLSNMPIYFALATVLIFAVTAATFVIYDFCVERRQKVVMKTAVTTTALVSSLFPDTVMDRIIPRDSYSIGTAGAESTQRRLTNFLDRNHRRNDVVDITSDQEASQRLWLLPKPIADVFPDTTVFFADIAGFTAWSSVREPAHVFTLLETLYGSFDKIAKQHGIFKVETIGDCYLAVCGLPEPRKNHAIAMARFAFACLEKMSEKTKELELALGPDTADLRLRIGMHSGPTTAGVLRGEKARFQLFGDTVNTASRMESTSVPDKIQVSQKTAELIIEYGKEKWLTKREDLVNAKGKGMLQTYWLERTRTSSKAGSSYGSDFDDTMKMGSDMGDRVHELEPSLQSGNVSTKIQRLVNWNVAIFQEFLEEIVAHRQTTQSQGVSLNGEVVESDVCNGKHVRDEIVESIDMPTYNAIAYPSSKANLDAKVIAQLRDYITQIASFYHADNGFHNFDHVSHVVMSTVKLLQRIASPDVRKKDCETEEDYFNYTFGISSDPLTKFAIAFSALIHDVDHQGVSNGQLTKEKDPMALTYDGKSVLEQHSLDLALSLLAESSFNDLRECIYSTQEEYNRFRQLTVNCVIATDIFDKELNSFRNSRWEKAFRTSDPSGQESSDEWNCKATITIECIIQASDVSHTMQHWHVYQKWNKCLFDEMYTAYKNGRSDKDPSLGWYNGELWFFDNYVIPLATKLRECEVFGVSCDEFLNYANENRKEWSVKGHEIVAQMLRDAEEDHAAKVGESSSFEDVENTDNK